MNIEKNLATAGERLRRARVLAGLTTRREFEKKYHISANTLQGWEQGKNPLSEKGAKRVVEAFKWEGLLCSPDWLLHGRGMPPRPYEMINPGQSSIERKNIDFNTLNVQEEEQIYQETQVFKDQNLNSIVLSITDDAMEPYFNLGDSIGGVQVFQDEIQQFIGRLCILELENNLILPRLLQQGSSPDHYTAACTNPNTKATILNLYNVKVISAAPIIWHRKKLFLMRKHQG